MLANSAIVVTASDSSYFPLACDLLNSVRRGHASIPFGVLDVGLTGEQALFFRQSGVEVVPAAWEFEVPMPPDLKRTYLAMLSRPFLPKYFPNHPALIYLDADAWVQMPSALDDLAEASVGVDAAITPEVHVAYQYVWRHGHPLRNILHDAWVKGFGTSLPPPAAFINDGRWPPRAIPACGRSGKTCWRTGSPPACRYWPSPA